MTTYLDVAREYFPDASDDELNFILWEKTGFPCFFEDGLNSLREQLATYKRAFELGRDVCYGCGKIRFRSQIKFLICKYCEAKMTRASEKRRAREGASLNIPEQIADVGIEPPPA